MESLVEHNKNEKLIKLKLLFLYNLLPFFRLKELINLAKVNKFFHDLLKSYGELWREELNSLSKKWNFTIDVIDPMREYANYMNRTYQSKDSKYNFVQITKNSIKSLHSAMFLENVKDYDYQAAIYNQKIKSLNYISLPTIDFCFEKLPIGRYKLFVRAAVTSTSFHHLTCKITCLLKLDSEIQIISENIFPNEENKEHLIYNSNLITKYEDRVKFGNEKEIPFQDSFITNIDTSNIIGNENSSLIIRLERKEYYFYLLLDGIVLLQI